MGSEPTFNIKITVRLKTEKKLNIGTSQLSLLINAQIPFLKINTENGTKLMIPGSTIKGLLRTSLIRVAHLIGETVNIPSVNPKFISDEDDIVTRLFGAPHRQQSKIIVDSIILDDEPIPLTHVRINDAKNVAEEGGLFKVEYLPIGLTLETTVRGFGLTKREVRALLVSLVELRFERIGKSGIVDVNIVKSKSNLPDQLLNEDPIIKEVWEGIGI